MRGSEIGRLRRTHVDIRRGIAHVRQQTDRESQTIPLNGEARTILEDSGTGCDEDEVFTTLTYTDGVLPSGLNNAPQPE